jgi:hypothetical protein
MAEGESIMRTDWPTIKTEMRPVVLDERCRVCAETANTVTLSFRFRNLGYVAMRFHKERQGLRHLLVLDETAERCGIYVDDKDRDETMAEAAKMLGCDKEDLEQWMRMQAARDQLRALDGYRRWHLAMCEAGVYSTLPVTGKSGDAPRTWSQHFIDSKVEEFFEKADGFKPQVAAEVRATGNPLVIHLAKQTFDESPGLFD